MLKEFWSRFKKNYLFEKETTWETFEHPGRACEIQSEIVYPKDANIYKHEDINDPICLEVLVEEAPETFFDQFEGSKEAYEPVKTKRYKFKMELLGEDMLIGYTNDFSSATALTITEHQQRQIAGDVKRKVQRHGFANTFYIGDPKLLTEIVCEEWEPKHPFVANNIRVPEPNYEVWLKFYMPFKAINAERLKNNSESKL